tara:strand:+ start:94 stop:660 length:567 start_codon:yes stop_codon:yes gene_type:complete
MKKVKNISEALNTFELLGIKDVTKKWQEKKGTRVYELPFKTMYYNGSGQINRFSVYKSGYVRKMVVYGKNNASMSCYQLNRTRKCDEYYKDYEWNADYSKQTWNGKYRKSNRTERIMIDTHQERVVYLCNYILKNYYRNNKMNLVGKYTMERVSTVHGEWWRQNSDYLKSKQVDDVKVIINGHRYNLS